MKGRLLPLGWWYYLNRRRIIDRCRIGFLGVLPEYQHTGVAAALYIEHFDMAASTPVKHGRGRLDPRDEPLDEPRPRGDGRPHLQACRVYERTFEADAVPAAPPDSIRRYVPSAQTAET